MSMTTVMSLEQFQEFVGMEIFPGEFSQNATFPLQQQVFTPEGVFNQVAPEGAACGQPARTFSCAPSGVQCAAKCALLSYITFAPFQGFAQCISQCGEVLFGVSGPGGAAEYKNYGWARPICKFGLSDPAKVSKAIGETRTG